MLLTHIEKVFLYYYTINNFENSWILTKSVFVPRSLIALPFYYSVNLMLILQYARGI